MFTHQDRVAAALAAILWGLWGCAQVEGAPERFVHPLDPPVHASGSFAEYRSAGRYHLGLDYKTFNRCGLPVRAVRSGTIIAINVSNRGYGNALWMRSGADQYTFAHLQDFEGRHPELEWLRRSVELLVPSGTSISLPPWYSFRAGEAMAHSGESGSGAPHLHFEILRGGSYLDPLATDLKLGDRTAPKLLNLFVTDRAGTVALDLEPADDRPAVQGEGRTSAQAPGANQSAESGSPTPRIRHYRMKGKTLVRARSGAVRLSIGAFDTMAAENRNGVAGWELALGNQRLFRQNIQKLRMSQLHRADEVYDPARTVIGQSYVYRLYDGRSGALVGRAGEERAYEAAVYDAAGNRALLSFRLRFEEDLPSAVENRVGLSRIGPQGGSVRAENGEALLSLVFSGGSLHLPGFFSAAPLPSLPEDSLKAPDGRTVFQQVGPAFLVTAESVYYRAGAAGEAVYPMPRAGTALYTYNLTTKKWHALAFARKKGNTAVYRFNYRTAGPIAQLRDIDAPRIARPFLWEDPAAAPKDLLERSFVVSDRGMGVRGKFQVLLDGRALPHEWVADRGTLVMRIPRTLLEPGGSMLAIRAQDFAGNASAWWVEFLAAAQPVAAPTNP